MALDVQFEFESAKCIGVVSFRKLYYLAESPETISKTSVRFDAFSPSECFIINFKLKGTLTKTFIHTYINTYTYVLTLDAYGTHTNTSMMQP